MFRATSESLMGNAEVQHLLKMNLAPGAHKTLSTGTNYFFSGKKIQKRREGMHMNMHVRDYAEVKSRVM